MSIERINLPHPIPSPDGGDDGAHPGPALPPPPRLYGRETELASLIAIYHQVMADGGKHVLLLSGSAGVGKTSLVRMLEKDVKSGLGVFASLGFDREPYIELAKAIRVLVGQQLRWAGETGLVAWRTRLSNQLARNGQLMIDLVPDLEPLLGPQPATVDLPPREAQARLHTTLGALLATFASRKHPLVLLADDFQSLDIGTLNFVRYLAAHDKLDGVLLICAYRHDEVSPARATAEILSRVVDSNPEAHFLEVKNLSAENTLELVTNSIESGGDDAAALANLVHLKSDGNPFFSLQFLSELRSEGLLRFSQQSGSWERNIDAIQSMHPERDVVELVAEKLARLPDEMCRALELLACLDTVPSLDVLLGLEGIMGASIRSKAEEGLREGLLRRAADSYSFTHQRLREAVYLSIPARDRATRHLEIARMLVPEDEMEPAPENLIEAVNQFERAKSLVLSPDDLDRVAKLNLEAGRQAKYATAYETARRYFSAGSALLDTGSWVRCHEVAFALMLEEATCALICADHVGAQVIIDQLRIRMRTGTERASVCRLRIELHVRRSETTEAVAVALDCLRGFGIAIPAHPTQLELETRFIDVWAKLEGRPFETLVDLPRMIDVDIEAAMGVLATLYDPALFTDERLVAFHLCEMVSLTLDHGLTQASAHAFGFFGFTIAHYFGRYDDGYQFCKLALDLVDKHGLSDYEAKVRFSLVLVSSWTQPIEFTIDASRAAFALAKQQGDVPYACYSCHHIITDRLLRGDPLEEVALELGGVTDYVAKVDFKRVLDVLVSQKRFIQCMREGRGPHGVFNDGTFDEEAFEARFVPEQTPLKVFWYWVIKARALFLYGDITAAADALERARPFKWASIGHVQVVDFHLISALTLAKGQEPISDAVRSQIVAHGEWLARWAESSPSSFVCKHLLLLAELARLDGEFDEAERLYEQSIAAARRYGFMADEAMANEIAGQFYEARGADQTAAAFFRNASEGFERWGATGKVRQLEAKFNSGSNRGLKIERTSALVGDADDLVSVFRLAQSISEELDLERLADKFLRLAVETTGAVRGFLLNPQPDRLWIEAQADRTSDGIDIKFRENAARAGELSETVIGHVTRTLETVHIEDNPSPDVLPGDERLGDRRTSGIVCMPLVKHSRLIGAIYLECELGSSPRDARKLAVLTMLAPQAAISLENARVHARLQKEARRLAETEQELRVASDAMPTLTWSSDAAGGNEQFNKQWYEYTGLTPEEAKDGGWKYTFHPDDRAASAAAWHHVVTKREVGEVELRLRGRDGDYRWYLVRASPFCDSTGKIIRVYGTESDIDDLKRAEALLEGEKRLFEMIATGKSLTAILDSLCKTIGELSGESLISIMILEDDGITLRSRGGHNLPEGFSDALDGAKVGPQSASCGTAAFRREAVFVDDTTTDPLWAGHRGLAVKYDIRACWSMPIMSTKGRVLGTIAVYSKQSRSMTQRERQVVDQFTYLASIVIERRAAEEALKRSEALLADGQRISNTGSWAWNVHTGKIEWSDEHCRIFGYRLEDVGGRFEDMLARMLPEESAALLDALQGPTSRKEDFQFEYRTTIPNGTVKQLSCTGRASLNDAGELVEYVGTTMDITERKRVENELTQSAAHLREVQAELAHVARATTMGELAASIAHEVNQPLTGIIASGGAALRWLSKETPDVTKARESLQNVIGDGRRASEVITRIRQMFRKELGTREPLDVKELIDDVVALTRVELQNHRVALRLELPGRSPTIPGDRVQLQQVFVNLMLNAVDAMKAVDEGNRILTIAVSPEEGDHVKIRVSDTGVGVPPENAEKIFRAFQTSKPGGMGMGLSICRSIVENHGGQLRLDKDFGPGCRFELTLPTGDDWMVGA